MTKNQLYAESLDEYATIDSLSNEEVNCMAGLNPNEMIETRDALGQTVTFDATEVAAGIMVGSSLRIPDHWVHASGDKSDIEKCSGARQSPRSVYGPPETTGPILGTCTGCQKAWMLYPWTSQGRWNELSSERMHVR